MNQPDNLQQGGSIFLALRKVDPLDYLVRGRTYITTRQALKDR